MANNFLDNALEKTVTGASAGGLLGPWGALTGAALGLLTAGAQQIMKMGDKWKADTLQQQKILNNMVADGYNIAGKVPKHLKVPPNANLSSGTENSINPKPSIYFNQKTGLPSLHIRPTDETQQEGLKNSPLPQSKKGGFGQEAEVNQQGIKELNARYYGGESGFNPQKLVYPDIKNQGEEGFDPNSGTGGFSTPEEQNRNTHKTAQQNNFNNSNNADGSTGPNNDPNAPDSSFWGGRRAYNEQVPRFTGYQQEYQNKTINDLLNNKADFGPIRKEELRRFHEETAPKLAEQYFGKNPNSFGSAYPEALGRGGASLGSKLASMQAQFEAEREGRLQNVAMQPSYDTIRHPAEKGFKDTLTENFDPTLLVEGAKKAGQWIQGKWQGNQKSEQVNPQQQSQQQPSSPVNSSVYNQQEPLSQLSNNLKDPYKLQDLFGKKFQQDIDKQNYKAGGRSF